MVRIIISYKERPTKIASFSCLVHFIIASRSARIEAIIRSIRANFPPIEITILLVNRNTIGISVTHNVYLGLSFNHALWKEVTFRNFIRSIFVDLDAKYLTTQVITISGRPAGIVLFMAGSIVQRRKTMV